MEHARGDHTIGATLAGRDPGTNVAVLKLATPLEGVLPRVAAEAPVVALATNAPIGAMPAKVLLRGASAAHLDAGLRGAAGQK